MARRPIIKGLDDRAMALSGQQDYILCRVLLVQGSDSTLILADDALTGA
jgi:hypothetical protein